MMNADKFCKLLKRYDAYKINEGLETVLILNNVETIFFFKFK